LRYNSANKEVAVSDTLNLSESAVAVLRFRVKGWRFPVREGDRDAFQELVVAGIMEPSGDGEYGFTEDGFSRREEILRGEEERIERERYAPPDTRSLSNTARQLLRRLASGECVEVDGAIKAAFRELAAAARVLILGHSFVKGDESVYRFTYWGWKQRFEWAENACATRTA
jgi:hypothetical protein